MFRTLLSRRRAEDARTAAFVAAIRSTAPGAPAVLEHRTDTVEFPRIVLTAGAAMAAGLFLASCAFPGGTPERIVEPAETVHVQQLEQPATVPAPLTGTDAGLITTPAPTVQQLEEEEQRAAATSTAPAPSFPTAAPVPVPAADPAPEYAPPGTWLDTPEPEHVQHQLPEERTGRAIDCPGGTVGTMLEDGSVDCGAGQ